MDVSISIVNYNTKNLIKQCVKNIVEIKPHPSYEIIIVDNNSHDGSVDFFEKELLPRYKEVHLIALKKNVGFGAGHDLALKNSTSSTFLIVNPDIVMLDHAIDELYTFLAQNNKRGIAAPKLLYADLTIQRSAHPWPTFFTPLYRRTGIGKTLWGKMKSGMYDMEKYDYVHPQKIAWAMGACLMIKRDVWDKVGGFDERYFMYYEDVDICRKAWTSGFEVWLQPKSIMIHYHKRHSAQKKWWASLFNKTARIHMNSHVHYFRKWKRATPIAIEP